MFLNTDPLAYNPTINVWNLESPMTSSQPIEICSFASDNCDDQYWHGGISSFNGKLFFIDYDYNSSVERKDGTWQKAYTVRAIVNISEMPSVWKGLDHVRLDSDGMENRAIKEVLTDGGKKELCFATEEEAKPFLKDFAQQAAKAGAAFSDQRKTKRGEQYWKELSIEKPPREKFVPIDPAACEAINIAIRAEIAQEAAVASAAYLARVDTASAAALARLDAASPAYPAQVDVIRDDYWARKAKRPHAVPVRPDLEHAVNS